MLKTKEEWLSQYKNCCNERDMTLLGAAYDVLKKNTIECDDAPWGRSRNLPLAGSECRHLELGFRISRYDSQSV